MKKIIFVFLFIYSVLFAQPQLKITEVFFYSSGDSVDFIEIYCVDDNNNGQGADIKDYAIFKKGTSQSNPYTLVKIIGDIDNDTETPQETTIIKTGEFLILYFNADSIDDDTIANSNKTLNIYTFDDGLSYSASFVFLASDASADNILDAVIWSDENKPPDYANNLISKQAWSGTHNGNNYVTSLKPTGFSSGYSISRYFLNNSLIDNNSYKDWLEIKPPTPGFIPTLISPFSDDIIDITILDTPKDIGGNLTVYFTPTTNKDFYRYNLYISELPIELEKTDTPPEVVVYNKNCNEITVSTIEGKLLQNNKNYYILVTYTNKYGYENRNLTFTKYNMPIAQTSQKMKLIITEFLFNKAEFLEDMVEFYCVDDGNNGQGANIAGYSFDNYSNIKNILVSKTLYKGSIKIFGNSIVYPGNKIILYFNSNNIDDTQPAGNVLKTYTTYSSLTSTDELIVLYNQFGEVDDAVGYTDDYDISSTKSEYLTYLNNVGEWSSSSPSSLIFTKYLIKNISATRKTINGVYIDFNSADDWELAPINIGAEQSEVMQGIGNIRLNSRTIILDSPDPQKKALTINIDIYQTVSITIRIYDIQGRKIAELVNNESYALPSTYSFTWNCFDYKNSLVPAGIYILYIDAYNNTTGNHKIFKQTFVVAKSF
ncbi:MAG TPA: hypothetical protein PLD27_05145 [bacterium]|nr:hypothetical protein [bacterium]HOL48596.1 hypothetical protein [bacterium]HPQ19781.1 hypothetical protein [bacterium]